VLHSTIRNRRPYEMPIPDYQTLMLPALEFAAEGERAMLAPTRQTLNLATGQPTCCVQGAGPAALLAFGAAVAIVHRHSGA
jgi:hypothetical protein